MPPKWPPDTPNQSRFRVPDPRFWFPVTGFDTPPWRAAISFAHNQWETACLRKHAPRRLCPKNNAAAQPVTKILMPRCTRRKTKYFRGALPESLDRSGAVRKARPSTLHCFIFETEKSCFWGEDDFLKRLTKRIKFCAVYPVRNMHFFGGERKEDISSRKLPNTSLFFCN